MTNERILTITRITNHNGEQLYRMGVASIEGDDRTRSAFSDTQELLESVLVSGSYLVVC